MQVQLLYVVILYIIVTFINFKGTFKGKRTFTVDTEEKSLANVHGFLNTKTGKYNDGVRPSN